MVHIEGKFLAIYSFPVPRSAPLRATMIGTAFEPLFFSSSNGAERNSHDNDGYTHLNIAIFSLAIYSFPVPRSAPLRATMIGTAFEHLFFSSSNGAERNSHDNDGYTPLNIAISS